MSLLTYLHSEMKLESFMYLRYTASIIICKSDTKMSHKIHFQGKINLNFPLFPSIFMDYIIKSLNTYVLRLTFRPYISICLFRAKKRRKSRYMIPCLFSRPKRTRALASAISNIPDWFIPCRVARSTTIVTMSSW